MEGLEDKVRRLRVQLDWMAEDMAGLNMQFRSALLEAEPMASSEHEAGDPAWSRVQYWRAGLELHRSRENPLTTWTVDTAQFISRSKSHGGH